jgi:(4-O-methyl)-D-glucuronate---lignin esterase
MMKIHPISRLKSNPKKRLAWALTVITGLAVSSGARQETRSLEEGFQNPPQSYGIRCWWWWLNGNITKQAITRDLEEMRAKGFSGACIFDAGGAEQRGNRQVPEGPMFGTPDWRDLYKHALKEAHRLGLVLSLSIQSGWNLGGPDITPAEATKHMTWSEVLVKGPIAYREKLPEPKIRDQWYRDIATLAFAKSKSGNSISRPIRDLVSKAAFTEGFSAADTRHLLTDVPAEPGEEDARLTEVINLTDKLAQDGRLHWDVPAGEWVILRLGYTPSDAHVSTASGKWQGRVLDYMSEKHFLRYWNTHVEPLMKDAGPLAGRALRYLQTDSWELGGINWTDDFAAEFLKRRGYDAIPYLPIVAGKIIENRDVSNRFLADFRKTISDLIAEKHYRVFAEQARRYGIGIQPESAGPHLGPFDGLKNYGHSEIMMSEFWAPSPHRPTPERRFFVKQAASAGHIYNRPLVGAEGFTTIGPHWDDTLWSSQKPSFDHELCSGLNLLFVHTFTCSPQEMGVPGQEYFAGTHFNPNVTWWDQAGEPIRYFNRSQFMLQQGEFVADVLYYYGDHVPNVARLKEEDPAGLLPGYDYDITNEEILLRLTVKHGRITLPHGQSYRLLVLPDHKILSLAALRKVRELVRGGATVLGPKPERTASLVGFPQSEREVKRVADELWGAASTASGEQRAGRGRVIWGRTARAALQADKVAPDFEVTGGTGGAAFDYIHHKLGGMDYYFVSNQDRQPQQVACAFRLGGMQPELWDPLTGRIWEAKAFRQTGTQADRRTVLPLELPPYGSLFVVFRKPIPLTRNGEARSNFPTYEPVVEINGAWEVQFDPKWGGPESVNFDRLVSWTARPEEGIRFYSGTATYRIKFDVGALIQSRAKLMLGLGDIRDVGIARARLNGKDLGVVWTPPFRVEIGDALKSQGNALEVEVTNSWRNRLVGDRHQPENRRFTKTNITIRKEWPLLDSGLLGPVQIFAVKE